MHVGAFDPHSYLAMIFPKRLPHSMTEVLANERWETAADSEGQPAPASAPRCRLNAEVRRTRLLQVGFEIFTSHTYGEVSIDQIARVGGTSKTLLYHYFPSKRIFYLESVREGTAELVGRTRPAAGRGAPDFSYAMLDSFLDYVERHAMPFAELVGRSGARVRDRELAAIVDSAKLELVANLCKSITAAPVSRNALNACAGFIENAVFDWIHVPDITRRELVNLCRVALERASVVAPSATAHQEGPKQCRTT